MKELRCVLGLKMYAHESASKALFEEEKIHRMVVWDDKGRGWFVGDSQSLHTKEEKKPTNLQGECG